MQNNALVPLLRRRVRKLAEHCGGERDEDNVMHILCMGGEGNDKDKNEDENSAWGEDNDLDNKDEDGEEREGGGRDGEDDGNTREGERRTRFGGTFANAWKWP